MAVWTRHSIDREIEQFDLGNNRLQNASHTIPNSLHPVFYEGVINTKYKHDAHTNIRIAKSWHRHAN